MEPKKLDQEDAEKLQRLYLKYRKFLAYSARTILHDEALAEDAVHDTVVKLTRYLHKVDEADEPKTKKFLYKMCINLAKTMYRKRTALSKNADFLDTLADVQDPGTDLLSTYINKEAADILIRAVKTMEEKYRTIFFMKFNHDCSYEEIAEMLEVEPATVRKRMQRIRGRLVAVAKEEALR